MRRSPVPLAIPTALIVLLILTTLTIAVPGRVSAGIFEAGAFVLAIAVLFTRFAPSSLPVPLWLPAALPAVAFAQLAFGWTVHPYATKIAALQWAACFAILVVSWTALSGPGARDRFLNALAISSGAIALYILLQPTMGQLHLWGLIGASNFEMAGPFQNRNTYSSFVELALPVAGWRALSDRRNSWAWWGLVAMLCASVVAVQARTGTVLIALEIVCLLILAAVRRAAPVRTVALAAAQVFIMAGAWLAVVGTGGLLKRFEAANPLIYRTEIYASTVKLFTERPVFGWGLGTFQDAYPQFALFDVAKIVNFAHNDWLQWAAEGGFVAAIAMIAWAVWLVPLALRQPWALGLVFVFLHAIVDFPMQRPGMGAWVFAMAGAVCAAAANPARRRRSTSRGRSSKTQIAETGAAEPLPVEPVATVQ